MTTTNVLLILVVCLLIFMLTGPFAFVIIPSLLALVFVWYAAETVFQWMLKAIGFTVKSLFSLIFRSKK